MNAEVSVSFKVTRMTEKRGISADVTGVDPISKRYNTVRFYPDFIEAVYISHDGEPWQLSHVVLRGPGATKGGRRSPRASHVDEYSSWDLRHLPEWARQWVEAYQPVREVTS
jgi:hypothetical protein